MRDLPNFSPEDNSLAGAQRFDESDELKSFQSQFVFPKDPAGNPVRYFAGHSLGLMPMKARSDIEEVLDSWGTHAVEGHFKGDYPWLPYHEFVTAALAELVGAKETEVVAMNSLTVNLHLMLTSFYQPNKTKYKILIENNTFPSDRYAIESQIRWHGLDPAQVLVELEPDPGTITVSRQNIARQIEKCGDSLALVLLGNCNYLSGQKFDFAEITALAHQYNAICGFNLAHGAGNLLLELHNWNVDFAVWCSYKYLNSGPGGIAGTFVHEKHHQSRRPRLAGWWGHNKKSRFQMGPQFDPIPSVEAWQLSNPPIFQLASLRASLDLFSQAKMKRLTQKSKKITGYLEWLIKNSLQSHLEIITPEEDRGSMLCLRFKSSPRTKVEELAREGIVVDFREPDIIRVTPAPLYNKFEDVFVLVSTLKKMYNS